MNSNLQTLLKLECALVQAPMAGGPTTPELVAAVTAAGALGSFGFAYSDPRQIQLQCQAFRELCARAALQSDCGWNANFFVFPEVDEPETHAIDAVVACLRPLAARVDLDTSTLAHATQLPVLHEQVSAALAFSPSLVSFHLGIPDDKIIRQVHSANCHIAMSATSVAEATAAQLAGADFIVAQGYEAGGHRGIFDPTGVDDELGTLDLVSAITDTCDVPVIAAGGVMDGSDIAAARGRGADAVQLGSAFLAVDECGSSEIYRAAIGSMGNRETQVTCGFSGRPARGIRNLFIDTTDGKELLPFPFQNTLTGTLRKAAVREKDLELMSLWAGTRYHEARHCTAAQLIESLMQEASQ